MTETNPFRYFLPSVPRILIIGSFPCYNGTDYGDWFYSGSGKNFFWRLLSDTLQMPATSRKEKKELCDKYGIALADIGYKVKRKKSNCSDDNLEIKEFNTKGLNTCIRSGINYIFFTSRFVEKHYHKLYPGNKIPCSVLLSPSPAANRHIGGLEEYKKMLLLKKINNPYDFRLLKYREALLKN